MKAKLYVQNAFTNVDSEEQIKQPSVFNKVFARLANKGKPLGKICPIYLEINSKHYVLGVLTHNNNGSTSFFPQLPGEIHFDHLTLQDIQKDNHHFTATSNNKRKKVLPLSAEHLSNGLHHVLTIVLDKSNLVRLPSETEYSDVNVELIDQIKEGFFTKEEQVPIIVMPLPDLEGSLIFQLFLIPYGVNPREIILYPKPIVDMYKDFCLSENESVSTSCSVIPHPKQDQYQLGIYCFANRKALPTAFMHAVRKEGLYSKLGAKLGLLPRGVQGE